MFKERPRDLHINNRKGAFPICERKMLEAFSTPRKPQHGKADYNMDEAG